MILTELSLVEAFWIAISSAGLVFAVINLTDARSDVTAARLVHNYRRTTRLALASGRVHRNWMRVAVFAAWTLLGLVFGLFEVPRPAGFAALLVLLIGAAGFAYTGLQEARERREIAGLLAGDVAEDVRLANEAEVAKAEQALAVHEDAARTATTRHDEMRSSMKATADHTRRIAENTEREVREEPE